MKRILRNLGVVAAAVTVAFLLLPSARHVHAGARSSAATAADAVKTIRLVKNPTPVPTFALQALDGTPISPDQWRGKAVILAFWATWCPPCREEIPELMDLQAKYAGQLLVVGLSVDEGPEAKVKQFVAKMGMNYPVAIAPFELQEKFGGIGALPTTFVLDTKGGVVQKHLGLQRPALLDNEVRAVLNLPVDAPIETFDDNGQVWLANAAKATELPGLDFSKLTAVQKRVALRELNERKCNCGCDLTLAECRVNDTACPVSLALAQGVVEKAGKPKVPSSTRTGAANR